MPDRTLETVDIELPNTGYPVHIGRDLLGAVDVWAPTIPSGKILILSDANVAPLYLDTLMKALAGRTIDHLVLPAGESQKSFGNWRAMIDRLVDFGALRDATIVALGGGVIGDLAGFVAATYMRGVRYVQVPTTLLAQVDASVGGKTAINHPAGKNLIGAFHQPSAVIIDVETLDTLPPREFRAGMAEVVKYGAIRDAEFFAWLEHKAAAIQAHDKATLLELIACSVRNKAEVVAEDEKEQGVRALLNFGHTFAHAIETLTGYGPYLHGEAVAIGMMAAARLSEQTGLCPPGRADRLGRLLQAFDLDTRWPEDISAKSSLEAMALDKKALESGLRLILLEDIGTAVVRQGCNSRDIVRAIQSTE